MQFLSSISGLPISAQSAAYAPTNSADVSAIASAYAESAASAAYQSATAGGGGGGGGGGTAYVPLSATEVAIGSYISALPSHSFAQGIYSRAEQNAFVQGESNTAYYGSFAQGRNNSASYGSFAQGLGNRAGNYAAVFGQYNIYNDDEGQSSIALAYGDGSAGNRHNLFEFRKNGTLTLFSGINDTAGFEVRSAIESKQNTLTFGYNAGAISSINGSAIAGGSGGGGGGGDLFAYHAPAHSIIFWFYSANYNPSTDSNLSNVSGTWTQLSSDSNIWQLVLNTGSWNSLFYNSSTNGTRIASDFEILSIDFTGVTSLVNFMKNSRVTRIREILTNIECSADGAFENTSSLRGDVSIPALHNGSFSGLFKNSSVESVRINSLYAEFTPGWEGDPEMGEPGVDDYYNGATCSNMFNGCVHLRNVEIYSAHVGACDNMFRECRCLTEISCMENWDFCGGSFSYMFSGCRSLIWVPGINCYHPSWQGAMDEYSNGGNTDHMFQGCISLQHIPTLSGHFGECSDASYMFQGCTSLVSIKWEKIQELGYDTYKEWDEDSQMEIVVSRYVVNNVAGMFQSCGNVLYGAVNVYQNMNTYWNYISQHGSTFSFCGTDIGSTELASIPRTWGGTQS